MVALQAMGGVSRAASAAAKAKRGLMARTYGVGSRAAWTKSVVAGDARSCSTESVRITSFAPTARLAPFVRRFNFVETDEEMIRALLPEMGLVMGFRYGGSARLVGHRADATLAGMRDTVRRMHTTAGGGALLAVFREHGAAPVVRVPLDELFGATVALDALLPARDVARTADQVASARDHASRVAAFEGFLLARLDGAPRERTSGSGLDPLVGEA